MDVAWRTTIIWTIKHGEYDEVERFFLAGFHDVQDRWLTYFECLLDIVYTSSSILYL
ncbi:uncharacterized protein LOC120456303 isoform X2 [Drosophila santomea]|nr:uncharacterized protein LOC120456303 isoform X2 [Drosophila santomea]